MTQRIRPGGENSNGAKFTNAEATIIKNSPDTHRRLAAIYGVSSSTIGRIKRQQSYRPQTRIGRLRKIIESRSFPEPNCGCWIWEGAVSKGYGRIIMGGEQIYAHRAAYEAFVGHIPKSMLVCHKCDNPSCVNPDHLFVGTSRENALDCVSKGRNTRGEKLSNSMPRRYGEQNPFSKLTNRDVMDVRSQLAKGISVSLIAKQFSVSRGAIYWIKNGVAWRHIICQSLNE